MSGRILKIGIVSLVLGIGACAQNPNMAGAPELEADFAPGFFDQNQSLGEEDFGGGETADQLPSPDSVDASQFLKLSPMADRFPQTTWQECVDNPSGQYLEFACSRERKISTILEDFLSEPFAACVVSAMNKQDGETRPATKIHIVHAGITADIRHSPMSLHSYNRAIDIKAIQVTFATGAVKSYTYSKLGNRTFYTSLRKCWGKAVHLKNGCPYNRGDAMLTGSIGWENSQHGRHMHLSVPYCVGGEYGSGIWRR